MEREISDLIRQINTLEALLRSSGEVHWADWLAEDAWRLSNGNRSGIDHLLSAFGGMGSLSDVVITTRDGALLGEHELTRINKEVDALRARIYQLADRIRREFKE